MHPVHWAPRKLAILLSPADAACDRGPPDHGELDYAHVFERIDSLGIDAPLGAEYKPDRPTDETLAWMERFAG